jgi:catechol 2,3-dioxygenase-like lactoylglutathione lyase family enzyme
VAVERLDFVAVPSRDTDRTRAFYVDALGLRPDPNAKYEFWIGDTCCSIYRPTDYGIEFEPQRTAPLAMHVEDIEAARTDLEGKGVEFLGETFDTGVCHMAFFSDPDGNSLMLHSRHTPRDRYD